MYRYSQSSRPHRSGYHQTAIVLGILALVVTCVYLSISYARASHNESSMRKTLIQRMQSEYSQAQKSARLLNPTMGSQITSMVATVRQHVYAMRTLNEIIASIYGNTKVNELLINNCIDLLEQCDRKIQRGEVVTDTYRQLGDAIEMLYEQISMLE